LDCHVGTMWTRHPRYRLGDADQHDATWGDVDRFADTILAHLAGDAVTAAIVKHVTRTHGATVVLPLYLFDHSGITVSAGAPLPSARERDPFGVDPGGWDTSYVGVIFDTNASREMTGVHVADVEAALRGEVAEYAAYLEGDVWAYEVEERVTEHHVVTRAGTVREYDVTSWETVDSCAGLIGSACAEAEAMRALKDATP